MNRVLFVFVDGVGIAPDDVTTNAFSAAPPPAITALLAERSATLCPLDATLGVNGLPQSGTGQFTLFTGTNGAQRFGRHYGPWVPTALRGELMSDNLLTRARALGKRIAFANAYPEELIDAAHADGGFTPIGPLRAGPPLVAAGADALNRHTPELERGQAISSEITNEGWRAKLQRTSLPVITAHQAGANLAAIAHEHELTLFAHYSTDQAGHEQNLQSAIAALHTFDDFVAGVMARLASDVVLVIASDHGNLEDSTRGHTRNPAFAMIAGPDHVTRARALRSLEDVTPAVLRWVSPAPHSTP